MGEDQEQETINDRYERETMQRFAAIGRFVQSFEHMLEMLRMANSWLVLGRLESQPLMEVVLNHKALTAGPLSEIFSGLVGEFLKNKEGTTWHATLFAAAKSAESEFGELISARNQMLHSMSYIGTRGSFSAGDPLYDLPDKLFVKKRAALRKGLHISEGPQTVDEIDSLSKRCNSLGGKVLWIVQALEDPIVWAHIFENEPSAKSQQRSN